MHVQANGLQRPDLNRKEESKERTKIRGLNATEAKSKIKKIVDRKPIDETNLKNIISNITEKTGAQLEEKKRKLFMNNSRLKNGMREKIEYLLEAVKEGTGEDAKMKKIIDFLVNKYINKTKVKGFVKDVWGKTDDQLRQGLMKLLTDKSGPGNDMRQKMEALVNSIKGDTAENATKKIFDFVVDKYINKTKVREFVKHISGKTDDQLRQGLMKLFNDKSGPGNDMRQKMEALVNAIKRSSAGNAAKKIFDFVVDKYINKTKVREFVKHISRKTDDQLKQGLIELFKDKSGPGNDMRQKMEALVNSIKRSTAENATKKIFDFVIDEYINKTKVREFVKYISGKTNDQLRQGIMKLFNGNSGPGNDMRQKMEALVNSIKRSTAENATKKIFDFVVDKYIYKSKVREFVKHISGKTDYQLKQGLMKLFKEKSGIGNDMRQKMEALVNVIKRSSAENAIKKIFDFVVDRYTNKTEVEEFVKHISGKTDDQLAEEIKRLFQTSQNSNTCHFKKFAEEATKTLLNQNLLKNILSNLKGAKNDEVKTKSILLGALKEIINQTKDNEIIVAKLSRNPSNKSEAWRKLYLKMEDTLENGKNSFNVDWTEESVTKKLQTCLIKVFEMACTVKGTCKAMALVHEVEERINDGKLEELLEILSKENDKIKFKKRLIEDLKYATEKVNISQKIIFFFPTAKLDLAKFNANFMEYLNQDMEIQLSNDSRFGNLDKDKLKDVIERVLDGVFRRLCQHLLSPQGPGKTYCPKRGAVLNKTIETINLYKDR